MSEQEWTPAGASVPLEEEMEAKELPESDRDELRRFAEFLANLKEKTPMPEAMKKWAQGEDEVKV